MLPEHRCSETLQTCSNKSSEHCTWAENIEIVFRGSEVQSLNGKRLMMKSSWKLFSKNCLQKNLRLAEAPEVPSTHEKHVWLAIVFDSLWFVCTVNLQFDRVPFSLKSFQTDGQALRSFRSIGSNMLAQESWVRISDSPLTWVSNY